MSQRSDALGFDGQLDDAARDVKDAMSAFVAHQECILEAQDVHGVCLQPTAAPSSGDGGSDSAADADVPVCILPNTVLDHLTMQLFTVLVQSCKFSTLQREFRTLVSTCTYPVNHVHDPRRARCTCCPTRTA